MLVSPIPGAHNKEEIAINNEDSTELFICMDQPRNRYRRGDYHPTQVGDDYAIGRRGNTSARTPRARVHSTLAPPKPHARIPARRPPYRLVLHRRHLCVVTEMALCNLPSLVEQSFAGYRIPEHGAKHVIRDVLSGLDYAYNDCNIIYTDVKITNVVTTVPQDALPKEGLGHSNLCPAAHRAPIVPKLDPKAWGELSFKLIGFGVGYCIDVVHSFRVTLTYTRKLATRTKPTNTLPRKFVLSLYVPPEVALRAG
ncbi:uncharacterized protein BT62DRAFT_1011233 [Guyanagaster necrorhizus]|uniref:non-specific serine/threonine protein kinase n=1 Tax=Guyanagaster necrorhizus TaxID=856835 RepID=A0A9P7VJ74_9AGAR|nr:uncharacterized protein BT62DRAFT_1011233 [Guyanagaster necrorhizus MCA 3950]KAG7441669.1 hypothetical protein BT62DRAFT_1011233 [Guyanagaster necrorhizus MCA 3950]